MSTTERSILPGVRSIAALRARHAAGDLTPHALVDAIAAHFAAGDPHHAWIRPLTHGEMTAYADALAGRDFASLPLYGVPFAIRTTSTSPASRQRQPVRPTRTRRRAARPSSSG